LVKVLLGHVVNCTLRFGASPAGSFTSSHVPQLIQPI
jgi:hypothetical protein